MPKKFEQDVCPCHGEPLYRHGRQAYCVVKRRASWRAAARRYWETPAGAANSLRQRALRIFIGTDYHSRAATIEQAQTINAHIRRRIACRSAEILAKNEN
jgi:hypothetical protein